MTMTPKRKRGLALFATVDDDEGDDDDDSFLEKKNFDENVLDKKEKDLSFSSSN